MQLQCRGLRSTHTAIVPGARAHTQLNLQLGAKSTYTAFVMQGAKGTRTALERGARANHATAGSPTDRDGDQAGLHPRSRHYMLIKSVGPKTDPLRGLVPDGTK